MITARRNPPRIAVRLKEGRSIPHRTVTCDTGKPYFSVLAVETFCDISMDQNNRVTEYQDVLQRLGTYFFFSPSQYPLVERMVSCEDAPGSMSTPGE
jgi:hypothetical protein